MRRAAEARRLTTSFDVVRRGRAAGEWALLFFAALVMAGGLLASRVVVPLDGLIYDVIIRASPRTPDPRILIVAIDDDALRALGRWPWSRRTHAALIDRLRQARAICYDVLFVEPSPDDAILARSLSANGRVTLPLLIESPGPNGAPFRIARPVVPAAGTGHVTVRTDPDGIYRRVALTEAIGGTRWPHLTLTTLKVAQLHERASGTLIPFAGAAARYPAVSFATVLRGEVPPEMIRGRIILIGATAAGLGDRYATPTENSRDLMPGIEVQANIVDALLHGGLWREASSPLALGFAAMPLGLLWLGFLRLSPRANLAVAAAVFALTLVGAAALLTVGGLWIRPAAALVTMIFMFPLWGWRRLSAVSAYLGREIDRLGADTGVGRQGSDRLGRQIALLDSAGEQMRTLRAQRDATLAFLSHDMRSPASAILTLIGTAPEDAREIRIAEHARRALRLSDQFVQGVRAEEAPLALERIDLTDAIDEASDLCWEAAQRVQSRIEVSARDGALPVQVDPSLLSRALTNLIDNALKYGSSGSSVVLRAWRAGDMAVVSVADRGSGMSIEQRATLFERFDRAGLSDGQGAGLGLSLVATVARRHGGTVNCTSRPGVGTVFLLELPLVA